MATANISASRYASNSMNCLQCGYPRTGLISDRCPECGNSKEEAVRRARAGAKSRRLALIVITFCVVFRIIHFVVLTAFRESEGPIQPWPDSRRHLYMLALLLGSVVALIAVLAGIRVLLADEGQRNASRLCAKIYAMVTLIAMIPFLWWDFNWCMIVGTG